MTNDTARQETPAPVESNQKKTEDRDHGQAVERLVEKLETLPQTTRSEVVRELFMGVIKESGLPKLDAEVVKIIAASVEKDNQNKFEYLIQKQRDAAELAKGDQAQRAVYHKDRVKLLWPLLIAAIVSFLGLLGSGIYFIATGKECLGAGFVTAALGGAFGYLGGLGTGQFFKARK